MSVGQELWNGVQYLNDAKGNRQSTAALRPRAALADRAHDHDLSRDRGRSAWPTNWSMARFAFAHGSKDRYPYAVDHKKDVRSEHRLLQTAVEHAKLGQREQIEALRRNGVPIDQDVHMRDDAHSVIGGLHG